VRGGSLPSGDGRCWKAPEGLHRSVGQPFGLIVSGAGWAWREGVVATGREGFGGGSGVAPGGAGWHPFGVGGCGVICDQIGDPGAGLGASGGCAVFRRWTCLKCVFSCVAAVCGRLMACIQRGGGQGSCLRPAALEVDLVVAVPIHGGDPPSVWVRGRRLRRIAVLCRGLAGLQRAGAGGGDGRCSGTVRCGA